MTLQVDLGLEIKKMQQIAIETFGVRGLLLLLFLTWRVKIGPATFGWLTLPLPLCPISFPLRPRKNQILHWNLSSNIFKH